MAITFKEPTFRRLFALTFVLLLFAGCLSRNAPQRPSFDPRRSGEDALAAYDSNSDGAIDDREVEQAPGLKAAFSRIDADGDGKLAADEIAKRVEYYKSAPTIIVSGSTRVTYRSRPLADAQVLFEPESFLGPEFVACSGTTNVRGIAEITGHDGRFPGIYLGFYRVRISKIVDGRELIPAKYNERTELGYEATDDIPLVSDIINFDLK